MDNPKILEIHKLQHDELDTITHSIKVPFQVKEISQNTIRLVYINLSRPFKSVTLKEKKKQPKKIKFYSKLFTDKLTTQTYETLYISTDGSHKDKKNRSSYVGYFS